MLSNSTRAAVCLIGFVLSGCMQSVPTAETITKPTSEAFARLAAWTPWRPAQEPPPVHVASMTPVESVPQAPPVEQTEPIPAEPRPSTPKSRVAAVQLAPAQRRLATRPSIPAPAATTSAAASILPAKVLCQTSSKPGERVRMECKPAE